MNTPTLTKPRRTVAIVRCAGGSAFKVTAAPADFAAAVEEVLSRRFVATIRRMDGCEDERIGAEFCEAPYLY